MSAAVETRPTAAAGEGIPRRLVMVLAFACGAAAANLYYAQPLLDEIARALHVSAGTAGLLVTLSQVGYALGLLFVVPLGDLLERRRLVVVVLLVAALALVGCAVAPSLAVLGVLLLIAGLSSCVAQVLVPFAAHLARDEDRGKVVGTVMTGLLLGILLARTISGLLGEWLGWRAVFGVAAGLMVLLLLLLRAELPAAEPTSDLSYPGLLGSVLQLLRDHAVLRLRCVLGALGFAAFSIFWTTLAFLLSQPPYDYDDLVIGLFGLAGAAGALVAGQAGKASDKGHAHRTTLVFTLLLGLSFLPTWWGRHHLWPLIVGVVVLDLGVQGLQITNQSEIYRLDPAARSRITTAYMTCYFAGGALGSAVGSALWSAYGWDGVCLAGAIVGAVALLLGTQTGRLARHEGVAASAA